MKIKIIQPKISKNHNDSVWYDGEIASFTKKNGTKLLLLAVGDIRIHHKDGILIYDGKERNDGIEGGFNDDRDLKKIDEEHYWENNNWFEVVFIKKGTDYYDCVLGEVAHEYDSAIELLKAYIEDEEY